MLNDESIVTEVGQTPAPTDLEQTLNTLTQRVLEIIINEIGMLPGKVTRKFGLDLRHADVEPLVPLIYLTGEPVKKFYLASARQYNVGDHIKFRWKRPGRREWDNTKGSLRDGHAEDAQPISNEDAEQLATQIQNKLFESLRRQAEDDYNKKRDEYEQKVKDLGELQTERADLEEREEKLIREQHALAPYRHLLPLQNPDDTALDIAPATSFDNLYAEWALQLRHQGYQCGPGSRTENVVNSFLLSTAAALYTGSLVLLNGPVGAGKTSIIEKAAEILSGTIKASAIVPVRPAWIDSTDLLGFFDPISNVYRPTPFVDALLRADRLSNEHVIFFLCLDELNLARIENYGADLLSRLEYGRNGANSAGASSENTELHLYSSDIHFALKEELDSVIETQDQDLKVRQRRLQLCRQLMKYPAKLRIPPNLLLLGSLNTDETTYELSPKVIDRSYVVTYPPADLDLASTTSASLPAVVATPMSTPLATDSSHRVSISEMVGQMKQQIDSNPIPPGWEEIVKWNREFLSNGIAIPLSYRSKRDFDAFSAAAHCFGLSDKDAVVGHFLFTKVLPRVRFTANNHSTQTGTSARVQLYQDFLTAIEEKYAKYDPAGILTGLREQASDPQVSVVRYFGMDRI